MRFYTIGHSSRALDDFIDLLTMNGIATLIDVRSFPHSPSNPQFDGANLQAALSGHGIHYRHLQALGGRRSLRLRDSPNRGWRVAAFRSYADYMSTEAFAGGLAELIAIASISQVAYMCAEAVPWRCHRRLISDCLVAKGHDVYDIITDCPPRPHRLTPFAVKSGPCVTYPAE